MNDSRETILAVRDLKVTFTTPDGDVQAVKGIDLDIKAGETLAVVGEIRLRQKPDDDGHHGPAGR